MCSLIGWVTLLVLLSSRSAKPIPDEFIAPAITTRAVAQL